MPSRSPLPPRAAEYVDFLRNATPDNQDEYMTQLRRFNMGVPGEADCPVFDGLFQYCQVCVVLETARAASAAGLAQRPHKFANK